MTEGSEETSLSKWALVCLLAVLTGVGGGLGAVAFRKAIDLFQWLFFRNLLKVTSYLTWHEFNFGIILLPIIGGLMIGPIIFKFCKEAKGHGVPEIIEAAYFNEGRLRKRVAAVKILTSAITIGSGGSAGREGPIAQIGAGLASTIGQLIKVSKDDLQFLVACGVAAGIAATFGAPIGGAFFGMEIILKKYKTKYILPLLISGVLGVLVSKAILGSRPSFQTILTGLSVGPKEIGLLAAMGIVFGFLAFLWVKFFYFIEDQFDTNRTVHDFLKPALGMSIAGIEGAVLTYFVAHHLRIGFIPEYFGIMGIGYQGIDLALMGKIAVGMLVILAVMKIIATSFTIGSGGSGGVFAPSLYIGMAFGLAFGYLFNMASPALQPNVFALAGMAALFAGTARAPLTCIFQIPEMSGSYGLLPGLAICVAGSFIVSSFLLKGSSIYTIKLEKRGKKLPKDEI